MLAILKLGVALIKHVIFISLKVFKNSRLLSSYQLCKVSRSLSIAQVQAELNRITVSLICYIDPVRFKTSFFVWCPDMRLMSDVTDVTDVTDRNGKRWPQRPRRVCKFFTAGLTFGFLHAFYESFFWHLLCNFGHFCKFCTILSIFLHIFCVLIFQSQSFACAIL